MRMRWILRSFEHRNFRLFFSGQALSLIGTQIQIVALPWFVLQMTGSPRWVGIVAFTAQFPAVFSTPLAGVVADQANKRNLLLVTQSLSMVQAALLAVLTLTGTIELWQIVALSIGLSLVNGFDYPARQALLKEMVGGRSDLGNAIALNSVIFNATRLSGPALAGLMIVHFGEGFCFLTNAASFLAVIVSLAAMRLPPAVVAARRESAWRGVVEGWLYAGRSAAIVSLLYLVTLICFLAIPYSVILPVLVREFFAADPRINGLFYSSSGLGALTAGLYLAAGSLSTGQLLGLARWPMLAAVALVVLSSIPAIALALPTVFALGFSVVMLLTSCNMRLQAMVEDRFRARMMSLYAMLFLGVTPLGSLLTGYLVETWGLTVALRILAGGLLVGIMPFLLLQATTNGAAVEGPTDPRANAGAESVG